MHKDFNMNSPMAPPWIMYPFISRFSIGWRMGSGEYYIYVFIKWFNSLNEEERQSYQKLFPEPYHWNGWYIDRHDLELEFEYSLEKHLNNYAGPNQENYVFFWGHRKHKSGRVTKSCFSQWYECQFKVDTNYYVSAEQFMMSMKARLFHDPLVLKQILKSQEQWEIKELGRKVRDFDDEIWKKNRYSFVVEGNYHKFTQNNELKKYLLSTGEEILVEASPMDRIWGIGLAGDDKRASDPFEWKGENLLGFALMEVRKQIRHVFANEELLDMEKLHNLYD